MILDKLGQAPIVSKSNQLHVMISIFWFSCISLRYILSFHLSDLPKSWTWTGQFSNSSVTSGWITPPPLLKQGLDSRAISYLISPLCVNSVAVTWWSVPRSLPLTYLISYAHLCLINGVWCGSELLLLQSLWVQKQNENIHTGFQMHEFSLAIRFISRVTFVCENWLIECSDECMMECSNLRKNSTWCCSAQTFKFSVMRQSSWLSKTDLYEYTRLCFD
jgi:hypothetical protein